MEKMCMQLSKQEAQLVEMATELGYAVTPVTNHLKEFAHSIAIRMINRTGENLYQSAAHSISNFPLSVLSSVLPDSIKSSSFVCLPSPAPLI